MAHFPLKLETQIIKHASPLGSDDAPMTDYLLAYLASWVSLVTRQLQQSTLEVEKFFGKAFLRELTKAQAALKHNDFDALLPSIRRLIKMLDQALPSLPLTLINTLEGVKPETKTLMKKHRQAA